MSSAECNPRIACRMREDGHWEAVHAMTDHLPECDTPHNGLLPCICPALRACEQRVIVKTIRTLDIAGTDDRAYVKGHAAGVQAARDAVAAIEGDNPGLLPRWVKRDALAAIDALRGEV